MKNLLSFLVMAALTLAGTLRPTDAGAQIVRSITFTAADDTLVNADTADVALVIDGTYKSIEAQVVKVNGTVAGTVILQGKSLDGGSWIDLDALTLTNVASQLKIFSVPSPRQHAAYRLRFVTAGTCTVVPKAFTLRYTGG